MKVFSLTCVSKLKKCLSNQYNLYNKYFNLASKVYVNLLYVWRSPIDKVPSITLRS